MTGPRISRRTVLRGIGASVALPFLDIMEPLALAAQAAAPMADPVKRLAYIYFPNGIPRGAWYPEETAADGRLIRLNEWMSPLEPFKEDILSFDK